VVKSPRIRSRILPTKWSYPGRRFLKQAGPPKAGLLVVLGPFGYEPVPVLDEPVADEPVELPPEPPFDFLWLR
jgi:hypothetical protein